MSKACSCGFILVDSTTGHWLIAHPTNKAGNVWDFPKGMAAPGEAHLAAAVRELREETGVVIPEAALQACIDFGQHPYNAQKDLHLYMAEMPLNISTMYCMSWVPSVTGPEYPECDDYRLVPPSDIMNYLSARKQQYLTDHILPFLPKTPFQEGVL